MTSKLCSSIEGFRAFLFRLDINFRAGKRFELKVINIDMPLESCVFAKRLVTRRMTCATKLFLSFMRLYVSS